ncbi:MAG TPA: ABC-F family ATP-binding cassette domain-containing protein [Bacteroidia bacterium]|nr:ABC-F family ATP-binding cassette domain-containing protein [Bacteroidia bacterium]
MNYLSVENLSKSYGDKVLFEKITFGISRGDKVALVAKNGTGKTTLLNILKGSEIADEGRISWRKELTIEFLSQEPVFDEEMTVIDTLLNAKNKFTDVIKRYNLAVAGDPSVDMDAVIMEMTDLNAWDYENKVEEILSRLQITQLKQAMKTLSGGQRKRVALARVILNKPDLLVLDEPTNHLDIEMIEWLENYLFDNDFTLLVVTHDRYFLNNVCNHVIEIENSQLYTYKGNFEYYLEKKAERMLANASEIDKAKNLYRRELEWVRKMPRARGTKSKSRVDAFYDVEEKAKQKKEDDGVEMSVKMSRLGSKILELHKINKAYGERKLIEKFDYVFKKGEKIGISGANGSGKTTLLNIIQGFEQADSGTIQTGETVVFGYYSQKGMVLKNEKRIIETISDIAEYIPLADGTTLSAGKLLARFNFPPHVQYQNVSTLSGGEKRRLFLLTILMKNPNFLILDEPTNDLDIATLQTLEDFLTEFGGCVLIVSHDRYFMDKLIDHLFVFEGQGEIRDFPGTYTQYRIWKDAQKQVTGKNQVTEKPVAKVESKEKTEVKVEVVKPASTTKKSYKILKEIEDLEKEIAALESKKQELETALTSGETDHVKLQKTGEDLAETIKTLDAKSFRWLELQD